MRSKRVLAVALLLAGVAGCGTKPEDVPLSGTWTGSAKDGDGVFTFKWELRESGGVIAGTGSFTQPPVTFTGDVTGSYTHPNVRMTLTFFFADEEVRLRWVGTRTGDDELTGVLHDADGGETALPLRRG